MGLPRKNVEEDIPEGEKQPGYLAVQGRAKEGILYQELD